ncbi:MAG: thiamine ABC transporter substrate binding subunit [Cohaesibacteraceae bacterium]
MALTSFRPLVPLALAAGLVLPIAASAQDRVLTIYTYDSFVADWGLGPVWQELFEAQCDCTIEWVAPGDGVAVLSRLRFEGGSTDADVVLGLDQNLIAEADATGLIAPHETDLSELDLPVEWTSESFVPFDYGYFAVMYDAESVENPPTSLAELIEGGDEPLVIQDPRTSTPGLGMVLWMKSVYGEEAGERWEQLSDRILTVTPGWSAAYGLFTSGETPMVLSYTTSAAYHMLVEEEERYQALAFDEGHYMQIEVGAAIAGSDDLDLAREFLAFMISAEAQNALPTNHWMLPVRAPQEPLPAPFQRLVEPERALLIDAQTIADERGAWIDEWLDAMSQ